MANEYDNDALREMCSQIDLLEYASQTMEFEGKGDSYAAHCPLHIDKTASLFITPSKNLFHCFSCGKSGNIINWLMIFEGLKFNEAVEKISRLTGFDIKNFKQCSALQYYKEILRLQNKKEVSVNNRIILTESEIAKYKDEVPDEWVKEDIKPEIMKRHNIRIDEACNRIVYPVYDNNFNLIGIKGRTRYNNYKQMKIKKYQNYHKIGTTDFFIGMKENIENIKSKNEVIIFEGIKSGMKVEGWGFDNWLASETGWLNEEQVLILVKLGIKDVVIAYDTDVSLQKIKDCTKKLRRFANVYVVSDRRFKKYKLLGDEKDKLSPCDKGEEVWRTLYNERKRV